MKTFYKILAFLAALAAIAGAVYVAMTYGDRIVAWAKKMLSKFRCCCAGNSGEEIVVEAAEVEEPAVQAQEADFEG